MIVKEFYEKRFDGVSLYITYSDINKIIHKIGTDEYYREAIDVENSAYEYEETEEDIQEDKQNKEQHEEVL